MIVYLVIRFVKIIIFMAQYKVSDISNVYWACNDGFKVGRDPMGIQNSSVATYGCILPGLTNLTGHIRYYSLYCWLLSEYDEMERNGKTEDMHQYNFIRRAELIMAFVMKDIDIKAVVGTNFIQHEKYSLTEEGYYDIEEGADYESDEKYWSFKSGAFGQYYFGSLDYFSLVKIEENRFYLLNKGKELAKAFKESVSSEVRNLFLDCIIYGAVSDEELKDLQPIGLHSIKENSKEWMMLNELLTSKDSGGSSLRRESILLMLKDIQEQKVSISDFVQHRFLNRGDVTDGAPFAWYFYYLCEVLHYCIETILCLVLNKIDDLHNPPFGILLDTITEEILSNMKEEQLYDTINEWKDDCTFNINDQWLKVKQDIKDREYTRSVVHALPLLLRLYNEYKCNEQAFIDFEVNHKLDRQRGIFSEGQKAYIGKHLSLDLRGYIAALVRQVMNEHTVVAIAKMGSNNVDLRKFILEDGCVILVEIRYPNQTNPRIESLHNFLVDMKYLTEEDELTDIAHKFIASYGQE